jgi:hypothetical protein
LEETLLSEKNALEMMGISIEEALEVDKQLTDKHKSKKKDSRICICGHAVVKHTVYGGVVACKPSALTCPCKKVRSVLEAEDTRYFLRKTAGSGAMHALSRGIINSIKTHKSVTWIIPLECDRCGRSENNVVPVPVTQSGYATDEATGYDALLCPDCRQAV